MPVRVGRAVVEDVGAVVPVLLQSISGSRTGRFAFMGKAVWGRLRVSL
jgi:hypothetical protein